MISCRRMKEAADRKKRDDKLEEMDGRGGREKKR